MSADARGTDSQDDVETSSVLNPRFGADGLMPAIATDADTGEVLMLAYVNALALERTIATGEAHYWSRSRGALWRKGEMSGQIQTVVELRVDCDQDALWFKVRPGGDGGACHTGAKTCFYRRLADGALEAVLGTGAPPIR